MDWLRRNWPDLLIGIALIAVIAGIIATLISGGSFFPVGNRTAETPRATTPATSTQTPGQPVSPQTAAPSGQSTNPAQATDAPPSVAIDGPDAAGAADPAEPQSSSVGQAQTTQQAGAAAGQSSAQGVEALPPGGAASDAPRSTLTQTPQQSSSSPAGQSTTPSSQASSQASPQSSGVAGQAQQSGAVPPASASAEAPYRVSVGAFSNVENAQRQLDAFRAAGYPAFIGTQGNLSIVLVGPYDSEDEARSVASRIAGSGLGVPDPTVYRLQPDEASPAGAAPGAAGQQSTQQPAAQPASQPAAAQPAAQPAAAEPAQPAAEPAAQAAEQSTAQPEAATSASRYLQVGAYATRESSLPQRARLEAMGFVVSDRVESGLVKLLVGPFDDSGLTAARQRLTTAGIESFPR